MVPCDTPAVSAISSYDIPYTSRITMTSEWMAGMESRATRSLSAISLRRNAWTGSEFSTCDSKWEDSREEKGSNGVFGDLLFLGF